MEEKIMESGEMYLETILILSIRKNLVRSIDIADYMKFSKPAVSRAVGKLKESKCIIVHKDKAYGRGRAIAEKIYERHTTLTEMLIRLGVDPDTAAKDACKIEHDISDETFDAIKKRISE